MSEQIQILEMPLRHVNTLLQLLKFSTENKSIQKEKLTHLREIEEHILKQIGELQ